MPSTRKAVREYIRRAWAVVPIPSREKAPRLRGWPKLHITEAEVRKYFRKDDNVGILLGERSNGLVDVDLDSLEAVAAAEKWLPATGMIHGRASKPRSHRWYIADPIPKSEKFTAVDGRSLVELRSTGMQTVIVPSLHPSGEQLFWESHDGPARVDGNELHSAVAKMAACLLLSQHWPSPGNRHEVALALAGVFARAGWSQESSMKFVAQVAQTANDEEGKDRRAAVCSTFQRFASGEQITGMPRLKELFGESVISKVCDWLRLKSSAVDAWTAVGTYRTHAGRILMDRMTKHGMITVPLCNFVAQVVEEAVLDDGAETSRFFVIDGRLDSGEELPTVRVPVPKFSGMTWVADHWGVRAVLGAGMSVRDQLREAIQRLSPDVRRRQVFTHTGWREIAGKWVYLTARGAVGHDGLEVDLGSELFRYQLPRVVDDPVSAMKASLRLLDLAPLTVTALLWGGMYRAPLATAYPLDLSLWIEGPTGSLKSTLAALFLSHFGEFDRTNLPGSWSSTANQLERRAFILKDVPFVIDDYAPSPLDARELETKAARLLRSQGNLAGRGRLRADLSERPSFPPRGLIVSTGEQHPMGRSVLARVLLVELESRSVNLDALGEVQRVSDRLPHAMAGFVAWLGPQMAGLTPLLRQTFQGTRERAFAQAAHLRVPEALAHIWLGIHCGLSFAEEIGACSATEGEANRARCWDALRSVGCAQGRLVEDERPTRRFLTVLQALVTQGRVLLHPKETSSRGLGGATSPIGWYDNDSIYLLPEIAFQAIVKFCRESDQPFPVRQERLKRDLAREGISECDHGRFTTTVRACGCSHRVLRLRQCAVSALLGEEFVLPSPVVTAVTDRQR